MSEATTFQPGLIIGQRYALIAPIGRGAMGEVWRAEHLALRTHVALKLIDPGLLSARGGFEREELFRRFELEARASAQLASAHVVRVMDHGFDNGTPYIAMELLVGQTLADRLQVGEAGERNLGQLSAEETVHFITHIARAIGAAHDAGILHRDIKPENVFIVRSHGEEIAKVLDFGIAKFTRNGLELGMRATSTGQLLGTPCYMSPEQATGAVLDHRSDLWSLAVLTYECLVGELPFLSTNVGELIIAICTKPVPTPSLRAPYLPPSFDRWWARASQRDPNLRFQSAEEFASTLREALLGASSQARASMYSQSLPLPRAVEGRGTAAFSTQSGLTTQRRHASQLSSSRLVYAAVAGVAVVVIVGFAFFANQLVSSRGRVASPVEEPASAEPTSVGEAPGVAAAPPAITVAPSESTAPEASAAASVSAMVAPSAAASVPASVPVIEKPRPAVEKPRPAVEKPRAPTSKPIVDPRLGL